MAKKAIVGIILFAGAACAADKPTVIPQAPARETSRTVRVTERSVVSINTTLLESTLIVLPPEEKVMATFSGDTENFQIKSTQQPSRYVSVKPTTAGAHTNLQIITDHNNNYSFLLNEVSGAGQPYDVKVFVDADGADLKGNLAKPAAFIPAAEAERAKQEAEEAKRNAEAEAQTATTAAQRDKDQFRASYPSTLKFDYHWDRKVGERFGVEQIYRDDKFTYIKANPQETPVVYEVKDGKPSLISFEFANNLYVVPKIVTDGYLQVGKERMKFGEGISR